MEYVFNYTGNIHGKKDLKQFRTTKKLKSLCTV